MAALSGVCAVAVVISPDATIAVFNNWFHGLDLKLLVPPVGRPVTAGQVVFGVISAAVVSFVGGAVLAGCYNLLVALQIGEFARPRADPVDHLSAPLGNRCTSGKDSNQR